MRTVLVSAVAIVALTRALAAQAQTPAVPASAEHKAPESYSYQADGRRDPFLNLLGTGDEPRHAARRGDGLAALALADISVRGIMQSRDALVAMVAGPDNKTFIVHQGDRLLDCTIKSINPDGLVVLQRVTDPLAVVKQREVHKLLRSLEDAKD